MLLGAVVQVVIVVPLQSDEAREKVALHVQIGEISTMTFVKCVIKMEIFCVVTPALWFIMYSAFDQV